MELRDYQEKAIESLLKSYKKNKRALLVLPTGAGKTVVFSHLVKRLNVRALAIAHTAEIIYQIQKTADALDIGHLLDVASIQLCNLKTKKEALLKKNYDMLIVDECHRICSPSYESLIKALNPRYLLGVTATPFRTDKKKIKDLLGNPVYKMGLLEMIKNGFLSDFEGYRCQTKIDIKRIHTKNGDFVKGELAAIVNVDNRNELIVDQYLELAPDSKALAFCVNVDHARQLAKAFNARGIPCQPIHGGLNKDQRIATLMAFKSGDIKVVTNCQILTEGFDEPSIETLLMARPTISKVLYMQMIGRGARKFPGKDVCKVIEFTDNYFNVCFLESLIDMRCLQLEHKQGQRLLSLYEENERLLGEGGECYVSKEVIIPLGIDERPATTWQIMQLEKQGKTVPNGCTEQQANRLLYEQ